MATLDILGLGGDPAAPQVPVPANVRKPAAVAQPVGQPPPRPARPPRPAAPMAYPPAAAAAAAAAPGQVDPAVMDAFAAMSAASSPSHSASSSSTRSPASASFSSSPPVPSPAPAPAAAPADTLARTSSGTSYTLPFSAPPASSFRRKAWMASQMSLRAAEYTETKELLIMAASWNVNAKKPQHEADLGPWLLHRIKTKRGAGAGASGGSWSGAGDEDDAESGDESGGGGDDPSSPASSSKFRAPDLYVVGFQEIVDLNATNLLGDHQASQPWEARILDTLARTGKEYFRVTTVHLVGLSMAIFAKEKHRGAISDVRVDEVGVGIMGVGGNKGAVLVKMKLYKSTLCFVNSHLAAHQGAVAARNADWWNIVRRASFEGARKERVCSELAGGEWIDREEHRRRSEPPLAAGASQAASLEKAASSALASASSFFDSGMRKAKVMMDNAAQKRAAQSAAAAARANAASAANGYSSSSSSLSGGAGAGAGGAGAAGSDESEDVDSDIPRSVEDLSTVRNNPHGLFHGSTHIVWVGDNNYRLDVVELGMDRTYQLIEQRNWPALLRYDQLLKEKRARRTFLGFTEPPITFAPTYKFIAGSADEYDRRPDKKIRFPAYTDRIQFMTCRPPRRPGGLRALQVARATGQGSLEVNAMHAAFYASTWALTCSDHKPVMSLLVAPVVTEREKSRRRIWDSLDLLSDEECQPKLLLSAAAMHFGCVPFEHAVTRTFQIRNVGDAVVAFSIVAQTAASSSGSSTRSPAGPHGAAALGGHDAVLTKPWLRILPSSGIIARDSALTISVTMLVTSRSGSAHLLTSDADSLAGELMLRLDGGQVYKISLNAAYEKSVCGVELPFLTALCKDPIRTCSGEEVLERLDGGLGAASVPHALFLLIDYMVSAKKIVQANQGAFAHPPLYQAEDELDSDDEESTGVSVSGSMGMGVGVDDEDGPSVSESASSRRRRLDALATRDALPRQVCTHEMRWILDFLDTGRSFDKAPSSSSRRAWRSPAAPAPTDSPSDLLASAFLHTLLYILASLPSPLLVASASQQWANGMDLSAWTYQTLMETEVEKYRTLVYVLSFAREIASASHLNGCSVRDFASWLSVALTHRAPHGGLSPIMPITPANICLHILTSPDFARMPQDNMEHQKARREMRELGEEEEVE